MDEEQIYYVTKRPGVEKFIEAVAKKFRIVIYTTSLLEVITQFLYRR